MFERFTGESRAVVKAAVEAAELFDHDRVHTGHLLLGLLTEGGGPARVLTDLGIDVMGLRSEFLQPRSISLGGREVDAEALAAIGVDYEAIRAAAERTFGRGALGSTMTRRTPRRSWWRRSRSTRFSGEAKRALRNALRIGKARGDSDLRPFHLLMGVLADPFSLAVRIMSRRGLTADHVRSALLAAEGRT